MKKSKAKSEIFDSFFASHYDELHSLCVKKFRSHDAGEDALHELFERMHRNAPGYMFPREEERAMRYMKRAITNLFNEMHPSSKITLIYIDDFIRLEIIEEDEIGYEVLLEQANMIVQHYLHLFTEEQLLLWYCIYFMLSEEEQQGLLGKDSQAIAKLRYKLKRKISRLIDGSAD